MPEILGMIHGYQKRLYHYYTMNRALRYQISGMLSKDQMPDIFDWEPLDGDPTKEERELEKQRRQIIEEQNYINMRDFYKSKGVDVM